MTVRQWLRGNGYNDVADNIDDILAEFKAKGSKERRNWADVLCGKEGRPVTIAGRTFPILASAQISRGLPVSPNAIRREEEEEEFPVARRTGRWPKQHKLTALKAKGGARKARGTRQVRAS
ncbi:MAG: hypothetical protein OXH52_16365 [Gammaproteobacteria bacterium]|nr:hypothetical protein [Gammaproteobacteria bacterium]